MKHIVSLLIAVSITSCLYSEALHSVHITVANIEYSDSSDTLKVSIKLFSDDYAHLLMLLFDHHTPADSLDPRETILNYFSEKLKIKPDGKQECLLNYQKEISTQGETWFYLYCIEERDFSYIEVTNTLLFNLYNDQTNLLIFSFNGKESGIKFDKETMTHQLLLSENKTEDIKIH